MSNEFMSDRWGRRVLIPIVMALVFTLAVLAYVAQPYTPDTVTPAVHKTRPSYYRPQSVLADTDGNPDGLGFYESLTIARYVDQLDDMSPDPPTEPTQEDLGQWMAVLAPLISYEDLADETVIPQAMGWQTYMPALRYHHVGGTSDCRNFVALSVRYANPKDRWHQSGNYLAVLAHELVHLHQGRACTFNDGAFVESTAELASWEVLAALANSGDEEAAYALVDAMHGRIMGATEWTAIRDDRMEHFEQFVAAARNDAVAQAAGKRSDRFWTATPARERQLHRILRQYAYGPVLLLARAHANDGEVELALTESLGGGQYAHRRTVEIDDLIYFINHAPEILRAYEERGG